MKNYKMQPAKLGSMATVISLDTNVMLRFLLDDIPEQTPRAKAVIEKNKVYVTDVVVVEAMYVLEKVMLLPRKDITKLLKSFLGFSNVVHNPYFLIRFIDLYQLHTALSTVDCYAAAEAEAYQNQLATFDQRLARQGGEHVKAI